MERLTSFPEGREGARTILGPEALCLFAFVFVQLRKLLYCLWLNCLRQIPKTEVSPILFLLCPEVAGKHFLVAKV